MQIYKIKLIASVDKTSIEVLKGLLLIYLLRAFFGRGKLLLVHSALSALTSQAEEDILALPLKTNYLASFIVASTASLILSVVTSSLSLRVVLAIKMYIDATFI